MSTFNPLNAIPSALRDINLNPLNLNLNPLNLNLNDLNPLNSERRDRVANFFQHGSDDFNNRVHNVVQNIRSNDYKKKMHKVLTKIKDTKEYKATSMADYDVVFESVDMYSNLQSDPTMESDEIDQIKDFKSYRRRVQHWFKKERISTLLFIPLLGIIIAGMGLLCDETLNKLNILRLQLMGEDKPEYGLRNGLIYVTYCTVLSFISVSCISFISPYAVGSGIPEMKSILSGINLSRVLGWKTLLSKLIGMIAATAAGLTIGRTGPFMHASAIVAHQMMELKIFSNIKKNQIVKYQMFICALASGVVANFGAPIGGLLFAIEITATNCIFGNLWKGFLCATTTTIIFYLTRPLVGSYAFSVYTVDSKDLPSKYSLIDISLFIAIGIVCGLIGALFVFLYEKIVRFRLRYPLLKQSRIGLVVTIAILSSAITYASGPLARIPFSAAMKQFIAHPDQEPVPYLFPAGKTDPFWNGVYNLLVYIGCKLFLTAFNITIPIPGGAITPFIVTGAAIGRLLGKIFLHYKISEVSVVGFAVIASAGLVSGTTRALSPAIFVLELTGQLSLLMPVLICSITSSAVGNFFNKPLFDTALKIQGLPFLSSFRSEKVYSMTAKQIMQTNINYLAMSSTVKEIKEYLEKFKYTYIPVVDTKDHMVLIGMAERSSLRDLIDTHIIIVEEELEKIHRHSPHMDGVHREVGSIITTSEQLPSQEESDSDDDKQLLIPSSDSINNDNDNDNSTEYQNIELADNSYESDPKIDQYYNTEVIKEKYSDDENEAEAVNQDDERNGLIEMNNLDNNNNNNNESTLRKRHIDNNNNNNENNNINNINNNNEIGLEMEVDGAATHRGEAIWSTHMLGDIIESGESALLMDFAPSQIPDEIPMNKVFHLFTMLGLSFTYVTSMGKLVGVITKTDLIAKEL
ncbi:chloride channel protein [Heterostelium album PN500]|uniref:Chloride channel protein n=1 Tax=Heterostelium pallidum (strain ATCC 26659 / Pp 5 / PN500) TaxID=670386 RepID=D3BEL5_HETP5|nr:chloride channel protein [Heterostelium album PN500]EFA80346.1 chloride channel protein [Heterostelium album PN500]|eukprot:XP_020432466.1 chloride channel protein [Heterostelium album PN500]